MRVFYLNRHPADELLARCRVLMIWRGLTPAEAFKELRRWYRGDTLFIEWKGER